MDIIKAIESNLHQFYEYVALKGGLELTKKSHYSIVRNKQSSWPNWVFRLDPEMLQKQEFIQRLTDKIRTGEIPSFFITLEPADQNKFYHLMEQFGMRQIYSWTGMALGRNHFQNILHRDKDLIISEVSTDELLAEWINVVNSALFNSKSMDPGLLRSLYWQDRLKLYLGRVAGIPAATTLSFQKGHIAGLYMIATMPEYRGKGYGILMTRYTIEQCFNQSCDYVVLHSSPMAESMYRKIGFRDYCKFGILWMVGKEYR